ncbi:MAG TPA: WG repeat-containing protein, partial [Pyrinomonadaceae bacterium]
DSRAGYIDKSGKIAIEAKYRNGEDFSEGLACVYSDKGAGFIDPKGRVAIDFKFTYCRSFSEGLAAVYVNDKYGFIDKTGKMIIEPQFAEVQPFSDGVAVVRVIENPESSGKEERFKQGDNIVAVKEGLFGVIDKTGKFILPAKFTQLHDFSDGLALVNLSDNYLVHGNTAYWGYINKAGKIVWKSFK